MRVNRLIPLVAGGLAVIGLAQPAHAIAGVNYAEDFHTAYSEYNGTGATQTFLTVAEGAWSYDNNGYVHGADPAGSDAEVWLDADRGSPNLSFAFTTATALTGVSFGFDGYFCGGCAAGNTVAFSVIGPGNSIVLSQTLTGNHIAYTGTLGSLAAGTYTFAWNASSDSYYRFDNFSLQGVTAAVPEPSTLALMLGGLAAFGTSRRKAAGKA